MFVCLFVFPLGVQTFDNYEFFIRRLTYIVTNIDKSGTANNIELIRNKTFALKCFKQDKETNTIRIEVCVLSILLHIVLYVTQF